MHFASVKSLDQQAQGMVLKIRGTLVDQPTQLCNTVRGHAVEFGVVAGNGRGQVAVLLSVVEQRPAIPPEAKAMFEVLGQQIEALDAQIRHIDGRLAAAHKSNPVSQRLATIPGVGPITALTLAIEIDPGAFEFGPPPGRPRFREGRLWAGLTPKEHSTGGKPRMGGISRAGHERLRGLLVCGATSVIQAAVRPGGRQMTEWLRALLLRKPRKLVAVALANKMARIAWAMMTTGETYRRSLSAGAVRHDRGFVT